MTLTVKPQFAKFIDEQVEAGFFRSPDEVLEAGLARLMLDPKPVDLDERDVADIQAALERVDRGEGIDAKVVHAYLREKYVNKQ